MNTLRAWALTALASLALSASAWAGTYDIEYLPTTSAGHDFNHAPVGQSFIALAPQVRAGLYIADALSFTNWLATVYPGQIQPGSYPYAVAPSVNVNIKLLQGEGGNGTVLDSRNVTLAAPFMGFVDVDYAASGITLAVGQTYTLLMTDISNQSYPNGVTGWTVPAVHDFTVVQPVGAYRDGQPILQGALVQDDTGIGDNAFHVMDTGAQPPASTPCAGANAVITSVGRDFMVVNGGQALGDHVWYAPQAATTFMAGTSTFVTGELVNFTGQLDPVSGCHADTMTVMPPPTPVVLSGTLPNGQVGIAYSASLTGAGGLAPYQWSASGLPPGISFSKGMLSGKPSAAGNYSVLVRLTDSLGRTASASYGVSVTAPPTGNLSCTRPKGAKGSQGKGTVTGVGPGYVLVKARRIDFAPCTTMEFGGYATTPALGDRVEWKGYLEGNGNVMAQSLVFN